MEAMNHEGTIVVDVRNHYESEIGHFQGALLPDVDSFREELPVIKEMLAGKEKNKVLLYCTGGIRCEKASAWLKHQGFQDVNQLHGGIIDYARQVKEQNLENKFIGKNFVFDRRMGERISSEIIAKCHQCGKPADTHRNCSWQACHILFIQCEECENKMEGCCSPECMEFVKLPLEEQKKLRKEAPAKKADFFHSRRRPDEKIRCTN
ncbi:MAG: rhodanese-related sulfurtransferase [Bdellovibrionota bacterium]